MSPKEIMQDAAAHIERDWLWLSTRDASEVCRLAQQAYKARKLLEAFERLAWNNYLERRRTPCTKD